jgi:hypothetical protein
MTDHEFVLWINGYLNSMTTFLDYDMDYIDTHGPRILKEILEMSDKVIAKHNEQINQLQNNKSYSIQAHNICSNQPL